MLCSPFTTGLNFGAVRSGPFCEISTVHAFQEQHTELEKSHADAMMVVEVQYQDAVDYFATLPEDDEAEDEANHAAAPRPSPPRGPAKEPELLRHVSFSGLSSSSTLLPPSSSVLSAPDAAGKDTPERAPDVLSPGLAGSEEDSPDSGLAMLDCGAGGAEARGGEGGPDH